MLRKTKAAVVRLFSDRLRVQVMVALLIAFVAYLHFDPASPWDPFKITDPSNVATPERRQTIMREYDYMLADPWGTTNEPTREAIERMQSYMRETYPEEFAP